MIHSENDLAEQALQVYGLPVHNVPPGVLAVATGTEARVCADIARRQSHGLAKYGTTVEANPLTLRQWLKHAYEEALDQAVYLRRAMEEIDRRAEDGK